MTETVQTSGQPEAPNAADVRQDVARKSRELAVAALEMEQLALLDEAAFDESMLLTPEELHKRYTGKNLENRLRDRELCIYMLARQCPVRDIARLLHMNPRTIAAIASQQGQLHAQFSEQFAQELLAAGAADLALAQTKRDNASYKDLHIGAGIKFTHALAIKLAGAGTLDLAEDIETVNEKAEAARKWLEQRNGNVIEQKQTEGTEVKP